MKPGNIKSGRCRPLALALLSLAFLLQAWIPPGYMLAAARAGVPTLVICPGAAPTSHHDGDHKGTSPSAAPCPFAALAEPGLPSAPPILAAEQVAPVAAAVAGPASLPPPLPFAAPNPPARGPPATR